MIKCTKCGKENIPTGSTNILCSECRLEGLSYFRVNSGDEVGVKYDQDKTRYDLIPTDAEKEVADVFTHGYNKYGDVNLRGGIKYSRLYAACRRHMEAFRAGERLDESGRHHIAHAIANLMMILHFELADFKDLDDL